MGTRTLSADESIEYLTEYADKDIDWHTGYKVCPFVDDELHPMKALHIHPEHKHSLRFPIAYESTSEGAKVLSSRKGETINGMIMVCNSNTDYKFVPYFLYHNLKISAPKTLTGSAQRVLCASFCNCHEPGSVCIASVVEELREEGRAVFIKCSESIVLHYFFCLTHDEPGFVYGERLDVDPEVQVPPLM
jgi:hypothetical protein